MAHIFVSKEKLKTEEEVREIYPSATEIEKVCGGWCVFHTHHDYETWRNQV